MRNLARPNITYLPTTSSIDIPPSQQAQQSSDTTKMLLQWQRKVWNGLKRLRCVEPSPPPAVEHNFLSSTAFALTGSPTAKRAGGAVVDTTAAAGYAVDLSAPQPAEILARSGVYSPRCCKTLSNKKEERKKAPENAKLSKPCAHPPNNNKQYFVLKKTSSNNQKAVSYLCTPYLFTKGGCRLFGPFHPAGF